jgi:methylated-DNA-protein-cysteine methyltransferase-like protein
VLDVIRALAPGEVTTYGDVAEVAGIPGRARLVGRLLADGDAVELPWWRVVTATGRLVPGAEREQAALLRAEGVTVRDGRVRVAPVGRFSRPTSRSARTPT